MRIAFVVFGAAIIVMGVIQGVLNRYIGVGGQTGWWPGRAQQPPMASPRVLGFGTAIFAAVFVGMFLFAAH